MRLDLFVQAKAAYEEAMMLSSLVPLPNKDGDHGGEDGRDDK